ncbi:hypothetical protein QBC41DRAFT_368569 [Cercophora samala]|uniref:Nephrocystin 3-like N-terminal domain-containing protein n=1 Tax=Cercophora samala TaxID=330535 RepID=A0AA39Z0Q4_9PEZI|nr:hypothetical protein QBC41DRAFT_368569 [Cercophora samala]
MQSALSPKYPSNFPAPDRRLFGSGDIHHSTFTPSRSMTFTDHTSCHYTSMSSKVANAVSISPSPAESLGLPPAPWFFDYIFNSLEYDRWVKSVPSRLLRLVGGPGSGKTSFAALAVKTLREVDQSHHHHQKPPLVLSIFLSPLNTRDASAAVHQEQNPAPFTVQFLTEIERQLDAKLRLNSQLSPPPSPQTQIDATALFNSIRFKLFRFSDVWFVVDDLDCLWSNREEYFEVEERLEQLRGLGVRILITSRTPFHMRVDKAVCDVPLEYEHEHDEEQGRNGLVSWWECDFDHDETEGPFWMCHKCKEAGHGCGNLSHPPPELTTNPFPVTFDISNAPKPSMESLIIHNLQLEHGQFWPLEPPFISHQDEYPPLSSLGRRLISSSTPGKPSREAEDLVDKLVQLSYGNPSMALRLLETAHHAESLDAVMAKRDRLPSTIVEMFDRLIDTHIRDQLLDKTSSREARARAALALHAIRILGQAEDPFSGVEFEDLKAMLLGDSKSCPSHGFQELLGGEEAVDEVIGATGGLLTVDTSAGRYDVRFFHRDLYNYVNERYNEFISGWQCGRGQNASI